MLLPETIPLHLREPTLAAVEWINKNRGTDFRLTGLVETERALATPAGEPIELGLVLCDGEICAREQIRVTTNTGGFEFLSIAPQDAGIPVLLDPPVGVRRGWLDDQLSKYNFILLLFYRGRW